MFKLLLAKAVLLVLGKTAPDLVVSFTRKDAINWSILYTDWDLSGGRVKSEDKNSIEIKLIVL